MVLENLLDFSVYSYPDDEKFWVSCGVSGGTGDPPDSSDGVLDKNKFPPNSETSVIGELYSRKSYGIVLF